MLTVRDEKKEKEEREREGALREMRAKEEENSLKMHVVVT
jgi:hypothetical protein